MLTKKKKEKDKSTIAKNLLSRYFSILSNNSLSLSLSIVPTRLPPLRGEYLPCGFARSEGNKVLNIKQRF